jgi:ribosome-associated protein YbcJ (S4-like RNA binding protein)
MKRFDIEGPYITLGQLLKRLDLVASGGEAKHYLREGRVTVNKKAVVERGRKLYPEDVVHVNGYGELRLAKGGSSDAG